MFKKPHLIRAFSTSVTKFKKIQPDNLKSKNKNSSSQLWLSRQLSDPYVENAKRMNLRCRSAFKLIEIDNKNNLLRPGQIVVDCGAAPGSWTQVAVKRVNANAAAHDDPKGKVISIDKQQIYPIEGATIFGNMDFTHADTQKILQEHLNGEQVHAVLSDMAPTATGIRALDNENIIHLCYSVLRFAVQISRVEAALLVKLWQCGQTKQLENDIAKYYGIVKIVKPSASRADSAEIFILGRQFKGLKNR